MALLERVVVPIADKEDAVETATALSPYLDGIQRLTVVHVIEKGGGVVDKAPMEKRRADARKYLSTVESLLGDETIVEPRIVFGTNVAETIIETAIGSNATAIVFCPRGGNRLVRFLSGDTAIRLVTETELPVVSITARAPEHTSLTWRPNGDGMEVDE